MSYKVQKSDAEWRSELDPEEFRICRAKGTEPAFSGAYWNSKQDGEYRCTCCGARLFDSQTKYDSGSGWPSFTEPAPGAPVETRTDQSLGMERTEVLCADCGAHLGHVFPDGPDPGGARYCINSASLKLRKRDRD
ncbi:MAG: peptide-methionine (R)-S-oxide reductase MsrB [Gammaproteobacteria bacterium]|nr:peptide-methionine (R)-S-oxide reductase MsrB [Gammaproteobacteria bacterium]